jgi:hypothetical protein
MRAPLAALLTLFFPAPASAQSLADLGDRPFMTPPPFETTQISVTVFPSLASNRGLPDDLRFARLALQAGNVVSPSILRDLADRRDGMAAARYVDWLLTEAPAPSPSDVATYAAIAAGTGRGAYVDDFIDALYALDPATEPEERRSLYISVLYPHAWAGNLSALDAVIDLNGEDRLFGPLSEATRARILEMDQSGRAAMRLALGLLLKDSPTEADAAQIDLYLALAAESDMLNISTMAANLIEMRNPGAASGRLAR